MKRRKPSPRKEKAQQPAAAKEKKQEEEPGRGDRRPPPDTDDDEELNEGFGAWLRTGDGVQYMRVFVVLNSLAVFLTMSWPQISTTLRAVYEYFTEDE